MRKVLITGITGFAGSHLAELLVKSGKYEVIGTHVSDRHLSNLDNVKGNVTLYKFNLSEATAIQNLIGKLKPDTIFHLAASTSVPESFKKPAEILMNNIISELNILEAVREHNLSNSRIVIIASAHVYGMVNAKDLPISENTGFKPDNPYAVSKIAQDYLGLSYHLSHKLNIIRLRPFNHIGPRQSPEISISRFAKIIAEIEKEKSDPMIKVGNLSAKRDFTDVRDMVRAYLIASEKCTSGEAYNIGSGVSYSIKEMLNKLISLSGKKLKVLIDPSLYRPSDIPELRCNPFKFRQATGWEAEIPLEKTLQDMLDYWRKVV